MLAGSIRRIIGATVLASALAAASGASAGLQKWSVTYYTAAGAETTPGKASTSEVWATDQRGYRISVGCPSGAGSPITLTAPAGAKADFAGPEIEPNFRVSKPGTDLFRGTIGKLTFDGARYVGTLPEPAVAPMRTKIKDGLVTFSELLTRTTISLDTQRLELAMGDMVCK